MYQILDFRYYKEWIIYSRLEINDDMGNADDLNRFHCFVNSTRDVLQL